MLHFRSRALVLPFVLPVSVPMAVPVLAQRQPAMQRSAVMAHDNNDTTHRGASVQTVSPSIPTVTLTVKDMPRERALRAVADAIGFELVYSHDAVSLTGTVSAKFNKTPVDDALRQLLRGTGIQSRITLGTRSVLLAPAKVPASDKREQKAGPGTLRGQVFDSAAQRPLVNATIGIEGTNRRVLSNDQGEFTFGSVEAGDYVLSVRRLGYVPVKRRVTVTADQETNVRFAMQGAPTTLTTVVTTGAGDRPRYQVGNSIAVINADSVVATQPIANLSELLANRAPGLQVLGTTGQVGAPSRLRVRGITSIQASNDPIIIVDGVRMNLGYSHCRQTEALPNCNSQAARIDDINPDIIESVEVLKGPAASTLFGSEAANGVIVVKTKRGVAGDTRASLIADQGFLYQLKRYPVTVQRLGQAPSVADLNPCTLVQQAEGNCNPIDSVLAYNLLRDPATTSVARGRNTGIDLNVSGGSQSTQFFLSGGYTDVLGTSKLPTTNRLIYERGGSLPITHDQIRPNAERNINGTGRFTGQLNSKTDFAFSGNLMRLYQRVGPDGMSGLVGGSIPRTIGDTLSLVPGWEQYYVRRKQNTTHALTSLSANWLPLTRLKTRALYGYDFSLRDDEEYTPRNACAPFCFDTVAANLSPSYVGQLWDGRVTTVAHTGELGAALVTPLGSRWSLQSTVGSQYVRTFYRDLSIQVKGLGYGKSINNSLGVPFPQETGSDYATFGTYLDEMLSLNDRLFFGVAARRDYASSLGPQAPLPIFPKWSVSWVASQEPFFPWKDKMSLRVRAAFGHAGTQPPATSRFRLYNVVTGLPVDTVVINSGYVTSLGNTEIRPERTIEREGGFEVGILRDRVTLDFTAYRKFTEDAFVDVPVPSSLGLAEGVRQTKNVGNVLNTGQEATLNARVLDNTLASWNMSLGFASRRNKLLTLGADLAPYNSAAGYITTPGDRADARIAPGYPLFGRWARPVVSYNDANNDGIIVASEVRVGDSLVYIGPSEAKYDLGIHHDLGLLRNRLHIAADFQYVNGLVQLNDFAYTNAQYLAYSQIPGVGSLQDQAYLAAANLPQGRQTVYGFFERANYLRFTALSVSYSLAKKYASFARAQRASIAILGSNLGLWSNYRGSDPSTNVADVAGNRYFNGSVFPTPRALTVRLNLGY